MEEMLKFLNAIYPLSPACIAYLRDAAQPRKVAKNEVVLNFGEVNNHLYFITKGALYCYYMVNGKPVPDWFYRENESVVSIPSFYDQVPSEDSIVAMESGQLYCITYEQYEYACRTFLEFNFVARVLLQKYLKEFNSHTRLMRNKGGPERYQLLLKQFPQLVRRIPVRLLAMWLGMTPEHLSRIRRRRD